MTLWKKFVLQIADSESFISRFDRLTDVIPCPDPITQRVHLSWHEITNILHMKKKQVNACYDDAYLPAPERDLSQSSNI